MITTEHLRFEIMRKSYRPENPWLLKWLCEVFVNPPYCCSGKEVAAALRWLVDRHGYAEYCSYIDLPAFRITAAGQAWLADQSDFTGVVYLVEATDKEVFSFWDRRDRYGICEWHQANPGLWMQIGSFHGRPIAVTLTFQFIDGHKVCFYDGTSELVDWKMINEWLDKKAPGIKRTNASNFHHCLDHIRTLNRELL